MMVIYLPVKFEFDWTNCFRVRVRKQKCGWTDGRTNRRNYANFERNLAMMVIYLPVKSEFDWTHHFRVRVRKLKMWTDGQTDVGHINLIGGLVTHNPPKNCLSCLLFCGFVLCRFYATRLKIVYHACYFVVLFYAGFMQPTGLYVFFESRDQCLQGRLGSVQGCNFPVCRGESVKYQTCFDISFTVADPCNRP